MESGEQSFHRESGNVTRCSSLLWSHRDEGASIRLVEENGGRWLTIFIPLIHWPGYKRRFHIMQTNSNFAARSLDPYTSPPMRLVDPLYTPCPSHIYPLFAYHPFIIPIPHHHPIPKTFLLEEQSPPDSSRSSRQSSLTFSNISIPTEENREDALDIPLK